MDMNVTEYGTVKWTSFVENYDMLGFDYSSDKTCEMSIKAFLKMLGKKVNKTGIYYNDNSNLCVDTKAYVSDCNNDNYCIAIDDEHYYLNIKDAKEYYPILKEKLDELCTVSKIHCHEKEVVSNFEHNELPEVSNNTDDINIYLRYLKIFNKKLVGIKASVLALPLLAVGFLPFGIIMNSTNHVPLGTASIAFSTIVLIASSITLAASYEQLLMPFKVSKIIKLKIKKMLKGLRKIQTINLKLDNELKTEIVKTDAYKNSIINYMSTIMDGANKLSKNDRRQKLLELRGILDEYTNKCQELHKSSTKLTLTDSERTIAIQTLDKLTTLEMEIAEMIRRDTENSKVVSESEDLREKINEYLAVVSADEKEINTKKNDDTKKVRVRAI